MDYEAIERKKIFDRFGEWFEFEEEVSAWSPLWNKELRIDVLAKPKQIFENLVFAIETKNKPYWKTANYASAFKQASDYTYAVIKKGKWAGQVINSSYVFTPEDGAKAKQDEQEMLKGIEYLGEKFRVGTLTERHVGKSHWRGFLKMRNDFWYSDSGYSINAKGILTGKRPLGGTKVSWKELENKVLETYGNNSTSLP